MKKKTFNKLLLETSTITVDLNNENDQNKKDIYLYLNTKGAIVSNNREFLNFIYNKKYYFYQNAKILLELINDSFFANTYENELEKAVNNFTFASRNFNFQSNEEKGLYYVVINEIIDSFNILKGLDKKYKNFFNKQYLVQQELQQRNLKDDKKLANKLEKNYESIIETDSIVYELYELCDIDDDWYQKSVLKSIEPNLNKIKYLKENYKHDELFVNKPKQEKLESKFTRMRKLK